MTKTFKFGEYVIGCNDIKVSIKEDSIQITLDSSKKSVLLNKDYWEVKDYLEDITDYFHAEQVLKWIDSKTALVNKSRFR